MKTEALVDCEVEALQILSLALTKMAFLLHRKGYKMVRVLFFLSVVFTCSPAFGQKALKRDDLIFEAKRNYIDQRLVSWTSKLEVIDRQIESSSRVGPRGGAIRIRLGPQQRAQRQAQIESSKSRRSEVEKQFNEFSAKSSEEFPPLVKGLTSAMRKGDYGVAPNISLRETDYQKVSYKVRRSIVNAQGGGTINVKVKNPENIRRKTGDGPTLFRVIDSGAKQIPGGRNIPRMVYVVQPFKLSLDPEDPKKLDKRVEKYFQKAIKTVRRRFKIKKPKSKKKKK